MFNLLDKFRFTADPSGTPVNLSPVNDEIAQYLRPELKTQ